MALAAYALTDYATVAGELGLSGTTDQALIERLIGVVSSRLSTYCNRKLQYVAGFVENFPCYGRPILRLQLAPLVAIQSIYVEGGFLLDPTDFEIHDAEVGTVYRENGWASTAQLRVGLNFERRPMPGTEEKLGIATYAGGWILTPQAYTSPGHPGTGQTIVIGTLMQSGGNLWQATPTTAGGSLTTGSVAPTFSASPASGATVTDGTVTWTYIGTSGAAGSRGTAVTLPDDLEEACILDVKALYRERKGNPNIKSESLLGASVSFEKHGLSAAAAELALPYARLV